MVIAGLQISSEAVTVFLLGFGGFLTAYGILIRAKAKRIEANAKTIEADATAKVNSAEAELAERLSLAKTLNQYGDLLQAQIVINQQQKERADAEEIAHQKRLLEKEQQDENNYRVLSQTQDRHAAEIRTQIRARFDIVEQKLDALPGKLQEDNKEFAKTFVGEFFAQYAEHFAELTLAQEWYLFPDALDPEWREEFVRPLVNKVRLYRRPILSESSQVDVSIMPTGETMDVIQGRKRGWLIVRLVRGTKALYGWLPDHEVITGLAALKRATSEVQVTNVSNPIPAT